MDRTAGIIRRVKILGLESLNGRRYLPEAVRKAKALYEGASVRINHPVKPGESRQAEDVFGWLKDVFVGDDGCLFGDLHFLKAHAMAEAVCEAAERNPGVYGLSHNAQGEGETVDGVFCVHEIIEVRSVDLVADPATTHGLFESRQRKPAMKKVKVKAFLEGLASKLADVAKRKLVKKLLEMGACSDDMEMDEPAADVSPDDALKAGFRAAMMAVLDDDGMDASGKLSKLKDLLKTHEKLTASDETEEDEDTETDDTSEDEDDDADDEDEDNPKHKKEAGLESRRRRKPASGKVLTEKCKRLCKLAGIANPDADLLEGLAAMKDEGRILKHLEWLKANTGTGKGGVKPRSSAGGSGGRTALTEGVPDAKADVADTVNFLRG
ncbi:MAG: hypothetical protein K2R98_08585 [Gemmataceae bacterium]|nr:hypothetical protein [Gemmataceae bacterium]